MPRKIEISHRTIVFAVFFLIFLWLVYFIRDIILEFFVALLIMAILNPLVARLSKFKIPRSISILVAYIFILGIFAFAIAEVVPPLIGQTTSFANNLPFYLSNLGINRYISDQITSQVISRLGTLPEQVLRAGVSTFSNVLSGLLVLVFAFYLLLARNRLDDQLTFFFGDERKKEINRIIDLLEKRLGGWARGELALMLLIGVANYVGLVLLGIPFAISLAILSGLLEIVPYVGPIISTIFETIIGLSISPVMGLAVLSMSFLIQQVENYIFVPKIMEKSVGVNPIIIILALTIGFRLFGFVGVLISVPIVITLQVLTKEYLFKEKS